ncbi:alpha/beta hydrolase family protein [Gordonia alkanivorans]|uniref:alpha/beta hydrolase n=1 Tax=Gordonia alkanivorans TaxID=84096 RepID=UPI00244A2300|nr:alpha/beta hydrolase family protein [Gordonia alkanivorans]MDH3019842.1 alpha/beta hydrolase family protein [Gordonia alkanivorans]
MTGAARRNTYRRVKMRATGVLATTVAAAIVFSGLATAVSAGPASAAPGVSAIERVVAEGPHLHAVYVHSASMDKTIKVQVLTPRADTGPRPSLYLLGGLNEQDPNNSVWTLKTDLAGFYADKNVNVVMPIAGDGSFYTDWQRDDPKLGRYKWETFLTRELPPLIDTQFSGNGVRGVAGLSMGAGAALVLAARNPRFYDAVAAYSGCFTATGPAGQAYPRGIVAAFGGDANNMWGGPNDPDWAAHDVLAQAGNLRGSAVYVSTGTGRSGKYDAPGYPGNENPTDRQVVGGVIEVGSMWCTQQLQSRLAAAGVPATIRYVDPGTHSWPYWVDQQRESWPTLRRGLGL